LLIGSLALISDATHNIADIGSLSLSLFGEKISKRPADMKKTYGYKKTEAIVAFVNSSVLIAVVIFILFESTKRIFMPAEINGLNMLAVALVAFVGNGIATFVLHKSSEENLNIKSAWLHSFQDALFSLGVIVAAIIIHYLGWTIVDPLISIVIALFLIREAYKIIRQAIDLLLDSVPSGIDFQKVKKNLLGIKDVLEIHDLHIWQLSTNTIALSAHLVIGNVDNDRRIALLCSAKETLAEKFGIRHSTLQISTENENKRIGTFCTHCN
jgi:cobalt-zinc-cadmium efflux system protein